MALGKKAKMRGPVVDPIANLVRDNTPHSNQVRFTQPDIKTDPTAPGPNAGRQVRVQGNTKGTGKVGVESSIALSGKRKIGLKLPANFGK